MSNLLDRAGAGVAWYRTGADDRGFSSLYFGVRSALQVSSHEMILEFAAH